MITKKIIKTIQNFLTSHFFPFVIHSLAVFISYVLQKTYRYRYWGSHFFEEARRRSPTGSLLVAVFHEYAISSILGAKAGSYTILVSESQDGSIINAVIEFFGLKTLRGSSTRGGVKAYLSLLKLLKTSHQYLAVTVDGPRGPRHWPKGGLVELALRTGTPIVPIVAYTPHPYIFKKSWDQTQCPFPFSKILFCFGRPLVWEQKKVIEHLEPYQRELQAALWDTEKLAMDHYQDWENGEKYHPAFR
jgi:lysophospholipid acyltransferase (LPLAT)-like uncharacterized protein